MDPPLTSAEFFKLHLRTNTLAHFGASLTAHWPAHSRWTIQGTDDAGPAVNLDYLEHKYAGEQVPVTSVAPHGVMPALPSSVLFSSYCAYLRRYRNRDEAISIIDDECGVLEAHPFPVYLKDWHFALDVDESNYSNPPQFSMDWLNEYSLAVRGTDYRFLYLGPPGTRTLLHTDVLGSFSWSTNIAGRKRWVFFQPKDSEMLHDLNGRLLEDITNVDRARFPRFNEAVQIVLDQGPGETVFVPSGWYHQVTNLEETLSINANWINSCNICHMLDVIVQVPGLSFKVTSPASADLLSLFVFRISL